MAPEGFNGGQIWMGGSNVWEGRGRRGPGGDHRGRRRKGDSGAWREGSVRLRLVGRPWVGGGTGGAHVRGDPEEGEEAGGDR